jgi:hypothetical protein
MVGPKLRDVPALEKGWHVLGMADLSVVSGRKGIVSAMTYGPDVIWPEHQDKFWREALATARRAGWTLKHLNAPHRFGVVSCPAEEHTFKVGMTPKSSETHAKEAEKKVTRCEHLPPGPLQDRRDRAGELLDVAERIALEVATGLDMINRRLDAYRLFDLLEIQLKTAAANVSEVLRAEHEAALGAAIDADDAAPDPPVLEEELDTASRSVSEGESVAKSMREARPGVARPLLKRASDLREQTDALRNRLEALKEQL